MERTPKPYSAQLRFYEELNDFLSREKRKITFSYRFNDHPSIKDVIESLGVPHTEVDLILVNGRSKKFTYQLKNHDQVSVYPVFESFDISGITRLRKKPLRKPKFILDVHLGKLARHMRLLGFDVLYENNYSDPQIVRLAKKLKRIILTRDIGLLKRKMVTRGYWLRQTLPKKQILEILKRFDLVKQLKPFARCLECNGIIQKISKRTVIKKLPLNTKYYYQKFSRCPQCKKIYWPGTHYEKLLKLVKEIKDALP